MITKTECPYCKTDNITKIANINGQDRYKCNNIDCTVKTENGNNKTFYVGQKGKMRCPYCDSISARIGKINGKQRFQCKECKKTFFEKVEIDPFEAQVPAYEDIHRVNPTVSFEEYKVMKQDLIDELKRDTKKEIIQPKTEQKPTTQKKQEVVEQKLVIQTSDEYDEDNDYIDPDSEEAKQIEKKINAYKKNIDSTIEEIGEV